jgi:conjugative transfer signal peptidase TraF
MRRWIGTTALCLLFLGLLVAQAVPCVLLNVSRSLPRGLYWRKDSKDSDVSVGDLVVVCAELIESAQWITARGYTGKGRCADGTAPLLKPIAAIGPARVTVTDGGVTIDGQAIPESKPLPIDSNARILPARHGETLLSNDQIFLLSTYHRLSLDSRYFGPVQKVAITMNVTPLLTEELLWRQ